MSITLEALPRPFCPKGCPHADLKVMHTRLFADSECKMTFDHTLTCANEPLCGMWNDKKKEEEHP